jgi:lipopolysaccharide exporter
VRDARWTFAGFAISKAIAFVSVAILARMLDPDQFGLMALAVTVSSFVLVFSDLGLGNALITTVANSQREGAIFAVFLIIGPALAILTALAAGVAVALGQGALSGLLVGMAGLMAVSGPSWFLTSLLRKRLMFRQQFVGQVSQSAAALAASIAFALADFGAWALFLGQAVGLVVLTFCQLVQVRDRPQPRFRVEPIRDAIRNGRGFFAQSAFGYLAQNADYLAVATIRGEQALGLYSMAYRLGELPYQGIGNPIYQVTFPRFARARLAGADPRPAFLRSLMAIGYLTAPLCAVLISCPHEVITIVYGAQWLPATTALALLGAWGAVRPLQAAIGWFLNGVGQAGLMAKIAAITLIFTAPLLLAMSYLGGVNAVAATMAGDIVISFAVLTIVADRRAGVPARRLLQTVSKPLLAAAIAAVGMYETRRVVTDWSTAPRLAIAVMIGFLIFAASAAILDPDARTATRSLATWLSTQRRFINGRVHR